MGKKVILVIVVIALGLGGFLLLKGNTQKSTAQPEGLPRAEESTQATTSATIATREIMVEGSEFKFNPSSISVKAGEQVRVVFKNIGSVPHDFVIPDLGIRTKVIGSGSTDTVEFTASKGGAYQFICSVPGHKEAGMIGKIVVE